MPFHLVWACPPALTGQKPQSLWHPPHCSTLTAVQNFPQEQLRQLMVEPDRLNPKSFKFLIFSPFTKRNHHKAIYLDHVSPAAHRKDFRKSSPITTPQLSLSLYKMSPSKSISMGLTSQQIMKGKHSLHKSSSWNHCPQNTHAYGLSGRLTLSDNNCMLHPASPSAPISRKLTLNLALNCGGSHTIQHTHFCLLKSFLPSSPLPCVALLRAPPLGHDQTAVGDHE